MNEEPVGLVAWVVVITGILLIGVGAATRDKAVTVKDIIPLVCMDDNAREHARAIMLDGVDDALKRHFRQVFQSWMKDPYDQPHRALKGMQQGMAAYTSSRKAAMEWSPPNCSEPKEK